MRDRASLIELLRQRADIPVLIVGGGINGVGLLRDLSAQGVAAVLVERGDIGSGTTAASSRLIHGGLRYLETGEFALVRESVREREILLRNAPHLVRPLPTWVPLVSWTAGSLAAIGRVLHLVRTPGSKGAVPVKLGLLAYDAFAGAGRRMPRHRMVSGEAARRLIPQLAPAIRIVAEYHDARVTHPERLALELVADAEADCPDCAGISYMSAVALRDRTVTLRDEVTGESIEVRPSLVVNAAGAWADQVDEAFGIHQPLIGGTKGSHLVLRAPAVAAALGPRMLYFETPDHRACLIYALDETMVLLGTTDLLTDDADDRSCTAEEAAYLFRVLREVLPGSDLGTADIVFSYAGVRPLPRSNAAVAGAISRGHALRVFEPTAGRAIPVLTLVGGKWTTYRAFAEQVARHVLDRLRIARRQDTADLAIGGGRDWPEGGVAALAQRLAEEAALPAERATVLVSRYGTAASGMIEAMREARDDGFSDTPLRHAPGYTDSEIALLARTERVIHLDDLVLRRTLMGFEGVIDDACMREVAGIVGRARHWPAALVAEESSRLARILAADHGVQLALPPTVPA